MKSIITYEEKCTGCRLCMLACSFKKEKEYNLIKSRITLLQVDGLNIPTTCRHCKNAPCIKACPVDAIKRDGDIVKIDNDTCIVCRVCIEACPFGSISVNPDKEMMIKCDLCDGDPECAKYCAYQAIEYIDERERVYNKRLKSIIDK